MIDRTVLDEILPVQEPEDAADEITAELKENGFVITNYHSGGVFYTILMIFLRIRKELTELLRSVLNNMLVSHAAGAWLDLAASNYAKTRKQAQKTQGCVTVTRAVGADDGEAIKIPRGNVFKTIKDLNGTELRYFAMETVTLQKGRGSVKVPVEAEKAGGLYNVPTGQITRTLTYLGDISISNAEDWIVREGSDTEDDESLRRRCIRAWSELALVPIHDTYVNICEAIPGVLYVKVEDQHPRGQGTINVIVTSEAGTATEELLEQVRAACEEIREPDTDILVKSAEIFTQDIALTVTVPSSISRDGLAERTESAVIDLLKLRGRRELNELTHADIICKVKSEVAQIRNVIVTTPEADLFLSDDKIIIPGTITVTINGG